MIERHFTATGIIFNAHNEILLLKHKKLGVWLPPGGHVDKNESPDEAVLREIQEETGLNAKIVSRRKNLPLINDRRCKELEPPFTILLEDITGDGTHYHIDMIYICEAMDSTLSLNKNEADEIGWFSFEQIKEMETFDNVIKVIAAAIMER